MRKTRTAVGNAIALVIIVVALVIGVGVGYFGNTISNNITTNTVSIYTTVSTYTTTPALSQGMEVLQCVVTHYVVFFGYFPSSTTTSVNSTSTSRIQTYLTLESGSQSVGYATTWIWGPTTTQTGTRNWNSTVCTVIAG